MKRFLALALLVAASCRKPEAPAGIGKLSYDDEIRKWQQTRAQRLQSEDSWLSLAGLYWLNEGTSRIGSDKASNDVVFPAKAPASIGTLTLTNGKAMLTPNPAAQLTIDGKPFTAPSELRHDLDPAGPNVIRFGTMNFQVIKRNDKYALRLKDKENDARVHFKGLEYFPVNPKWRIEAQFSPYNPPKKIPITNVLGMTGDETSPGAIAFSVDGKEYSIDPILEAGESDYFIIFRDATAGKETYPAARYMYAAPPGKDGKVILDFNKAYNPPCAFTPYATCPLPPPQNKLPFRIEAGEKQYAGGGHGPLR
jgi:uncharacterized protein (DUF1684 family)